MLTSEASSAKGALRSRYHRIPNFYNKVRKWVRKRFGRQLSVMDPSYLLAIQVDSYRQFLQKDIPADQREDVGLHAVFKSIFPVSGYPGSSGVLEYVDYRIGEPAFEVEECIARGRTYSAPLRAKMRLVVYDKEDLENKTIKHIREQEVYIADIPLMTNGGFVINGTDRIVVSQLHRAPGVLFERDKTKKHVSGRALYTARIIPYRGSWLDFEFDTKNNLFVKIDKHRKLPVTLLLRAFGYNNEEMLDIFFEHDTFSIEDGKIQLALVSERLWGEIASFDIADKEGNILVSQGQRIVARHIQQLKENEIHQITTPREYLIGKVLAKPVFNTETGEILGEVNEELTEESIQSYIESGVSEIATIYTNEFSSGGYISTTLRFDPTRTIQEALTEVYRCMRPGEFPTQEAAEALFKDLFSSLERYDLSAIGRMKLNYRLGRASTEGSRLLEKEDIIDVLKTLIAIRDGKENVDEVDHLGNRRVRSAGEMVANQFRIGLAKIERNIKDGLSKVEVEDYMPENLINAKSVSAAIKEFFTTNPLCQLKDDVNPLSPQWRRISALGKGGVPSDRAGMELRDVDATHYSRLCFIETPEGANIGLINALALLAKVDEFGFLVAPYRKVINGKVTKEIHYLSALTEGRYIIAHINVALDAEGKLLDEVIPARYQGESILTTADKVNYMDVSSSQVVSVAASLIPFLEHNDANRSLMGSNMQRQAVPLLTAEKPLVGTGMEYKVAVDYNAVIVAQRSGIVDAVDSSRIVIRVDNKEILNEEGVDIYNLTKYGRSNQGTCRNQSPLVQQGDQVRKGDLLADGSSTDRGELALGRNLLVGFMSWHGYNFEDSIILSERVANQDIFTSIHLEDLSCIARETPFGEEEITADIPNVNPSMLSNLDETGIIRLGAFVKPGDIIVGKVTPKGEVQLTPEEKLLRAIFGEKASDVKDTSLRVPSGMSGKVIDVSVFTREELEKDSRSRDIEAAILEKFKKDLDDELRIHEEDIYQRVEELLIGATAKKGPKRLKANTIIDKELLNSLTKDQWFKIELSDVSTDEALKGFEDRLTHIQKVNKEKYDRKHKRLMQGDELNPGVLKIVKVRLAVNRRIQAGDKIAGRHGNKGVISTVVPVEDMPHMEDGTPLDIILNPLGVPSRMNIGQILETHLGWAAKELGAKISRLLDEKAPISEVRQLLEAIYRQGKSEEVEISEMTDEEVINLAHYLRDGVPIATPVFDGIKEEEIRSLLDLAGLPTSGQTTLYDGQTGRAFDRPVTVGYMYMLKLNHLVDDKMHARSTGSYSLVTQQPLGGKAQFGGQRFGEMEIWALQAYGAAYTLREIQTIKSDDVPGRAAAYKNIVDGKLADIKPGSPESWNVAMKEMLALGLDVKLQAKESIDLEGIDSFGDSEDLKNEKN